MTLALRKSSPVPLRPASSSAVTQKHKRHRAIWRAIREQQKSLRADGFGVESAARGAVKIVEDRRQREWDRAHPPSEEQKRQARNAAARRNQQRWRERAKAMELAEQMAARARISTDRRLRDLAEEFVRLTKKTKKASAA